HVVKSSVVCLIFYISRFEKLTTVTNILLLNLILSSMIFMSSLPFMAVYMQLSNWIFGTVICKIVGGMYYLGIYSSVLFLTLLTFDRHLAVVYSLSAVRMRNVSYARISCGVVWLVSILACAKQMILRTTFEHSFENRIFCDEYPLISPLYSQLRQMLVKQFPALKNHVSVNSELVILVQ
uniref:G-protein coupled receptors family 1 profile domain-containing protein n=2 Tax=Tetraodon nigroviridis TaxID=99883 RepID=H3CJW8_TETNG